jgi:colanic acid biosynthesis glycosyl transferase WcaI
MKALGISGDRLELIYDWVDIDLIQPMPRTNSFSQEHGLDGHFVVLYAGNLGLSQGLDTVLDAARKLANDPEIVFLFVGDGAGRQRLVSSASGLNNVCFLPFQPRERLSEVLASADLSLVVLKQGIGSSSLPSKTFSILASARPVLACVDQGSDTWNLIQRSQSGLCVVSENATLLADAILAMKKDPDRGTQMGMNGRVWAEKYHSPQAAAEQFERLLASAMIDGKR